MEQEKYTHPLNEQHPGLFNICNGQVVPNTVSVQDPSAIRSEQSKQFSAVLSSNLHTSLKRKVKSMEALKKAVIVKWNLIYDVEIDRYRFLIHNLIHKVQIKGCLYGYLRGSLRKP